MREQQDKNAQEPVLATIEAEHVRFVNLEFTDIVGMAKCVTIPVEQFPAGFVRKVRQGGVFYVAV